MRGRLRAACGRLAGLEPAVVILAAPLLWFPALRPAWTAAALVGLVGVWLLGWVGRGRPGARTPLDGALLVVALTIPVGVWASGYPAATLPKLTGLVLGLAAFRAVVTAAGGSRGGVVPPQGRKTPSGMAPPLQRVVAVFLLLGLALAAVGLVGVWQVNKLPALGATLGRVPRLIAGLPGAESGVHPNELGGTVVLFLPVALAVAVGGKTPPLQRVLGLVLVLFFGAVLVLSQSRSAWFGAAAGLAAMAWLRWRRARWPMVAGAAILAAGLLVVGPQVAAKAIAPGEGQGLEYVLSLGERVDPWGRAVDALAQFPLTGVGLGAFREVANLFGPEPLSRPDLDLAHAHNVWLQVGVDLGVPGLVGYVALVGAALWCCIRAARRAGGLRWLAVGVAGALVAFHVYGIADTIAPGAKPGVGLWMLLGLAAALGTQQTGTAPVEQRMG